MNESSRHVQWPWWLECLFFLTLNESRISPTVDKAKKKKKLSHLSSHHAFSPCLSLPPFFFHPSSPSSSLSFSGWCLQFKAHSAHGRGDLICRACYKGDLEGEVWLRCSKPGWERGLIESSERDYFTFRATPSPADLGIVLRMKRWHKFREREESEWEWRERERTGREEDRRVGENITDKRRKVASYTL